MKRVSLLNNPTVVCTISEPFFLQPPFFPPLQQPTLPGLQTTPHRDSLTELCLRPHCGSPPSLPGSPCREWKPSATLFILPWLYFSPVCIHRTLIFHENFSGKFSKKITLHCFCFRNILKIHFSKQWKTLLPSSELIAPSPDNRPPNQTHCVIVYPLKSTLLILNSHIVNFAQSQSGPHTEKTLNHTPKNLINILLLPSFFQKGCFSYCFVFSMVSFSVFPGNLTVNGFLFFL